MERLVEKERLIEKPVIWWILIIAAAAGLGGWYYWLTHQSALTPEAPVAQPAPQPVTPAPAPPAPPAIRNPIEPTAEGAALPGLDQSDAAMAEALGGVFGERALHGILNPDQLIHRIVATVDNLARSRASIETWPVKPTAGHFLAGHSGDSAVIGNENAGRYALYVRLAQTIDATKLAAAYIHFYPLFQQAYRDLGYPNGYFNDRLVEVIDDLLGAPDVPPPVKLIAPHAMFEYADPGLEARSAGQKIMIRIGPTDEAIVKAKLREIRNAVAHEKLPAP